ncbi:hypothetical protein DPX16_7831 [Anabarilius grahami]|uniref:Uncharacterized protein n=1 Tax=Anabarilius grahami TaxID=495550 RepID=A0A3N0XJM9_ANAGA|nr:hypothetical protein DPX16_7831 [Anabarilius grahami]
MEDVNITRECCGSSGISVLRCCRVFVDGWLVTPHALPPFLLSINARKKESNKGPFEWKEMAELNYAKFKNQPNNNKYCCSDEIALSHRTKLGHGVTLKCKGRPVMTGVTARFTFQRSVLEVFSGRQGSV